MTQGSDLCSLRTMASLCLGLQLSSGMRIITSKPDAMVHSQKRVVAQSRSCLISVGGRHERQVEKLNHLEESEVELLPCGVKRNQLTRLGDMVRRPPGRLPGQVFWASPTGEKSQGRSSTRQRAVRG